MLGRCNDITLRRETISSCEDSEKNRRFKKVKTHRRFKITNDKVCFSKTENHLYSEMYMQQDR